MRQKVITMLVVCALFVGLLPMSPTYAAATKDKPPFGTVYQDLQPIFNVAQDKVFTLKLKLGKDEPYYFVDDYIKVFSDREATQELLADVKYDTKTKTVTIRPDTSSWGMYPREGVDTSVKRSWGGLQKYYIVIAIDTNAVKFTKLKTPKRLMFTVGSPVDIPTIEVKTQEDGNLALQWNPVKGASQYKVYYGSRYKMELLDKTTSNHFVLTEEEYKETSMNTLVSSVYEYAVTAVVNGKESRLSNIIDGEELEPLALYGIPSDTETIYSIDELDSITELPRTVPVRTRKYLGDGEYLTKELPVIWDIRNPERTEFGNYPKFIGQVMGTTFKITATFSELPTEEEINAFEQGYTVPNVGAEDITDKINIESVPDQPVTPSTTPTDITKAVEVTPPVTNPTTTSGLEKAIADGLLARNTTINLSAYPDAGDSAVLIDTLEKVMTQYPLILDEEEFSFDYSKKTLLVKYSKASKETIVKQQNEIKAKVKSVVASIIKPNMTAEQKEKAIHDWIIENGRYQDEVLQEYLDGGDTAAISEKYSSAFNPYGILIKGVGVCQSYAEVFKLLADEAKLPAVVMTGTLGTVPHAWNMVQADGKSWYHVDVTNNDGEGAIPYAVFNTPDAFMMKDYTFGKEFALDKDLPIYASSNQKLDYYVKQGLYANNESELTRLIEKGFANGQTFYIKVSPALNDEEVYAYLKDTYQSAPSAPENIRFGRMFNVLAVVY